MYLSNEPNTREPLRLSCPPYEEPTQKLTIYRDTKDLQKVTWFTDSTKFALEQDSLSEYAVAKMDDGGEFKIEGSRIEFSGKNAINWKKSRIDRVSYTNADWGFSYYEPRIDKLIRKLESTDIMEELVSRADSIIGSESKNHIKTTKSDPGLIVGAQGADKIIGNSSDNMIAATGISGECPSGYWFSADYSEKTKDVLTGRAGEDTFYVGHGSKIKDVDVGETIILQNDSSGSLNELITESWATCEPVVIEGIEGCLMEPSGALEDALEEPQIIQKNNKTIVKMGDISFTTNSALLSGEGWCPQWGPCQYKFEVLELL